QNRIAHRDAFIADIRAGVIGGRRNELGNGVLRFVTERAAENFVSSCPCSHGSILLSTTCPGDGPLFPTLMVASVSKIPAGLRGRSLQTELHLGHRDRSISYAHIEAQLDHLRAPMRQLSIQL